MHQTDGQTEEETDEQARAGTDRKTDIEIFYFKIYHCYSKSINNKII